ncbi:putative RiPP precursor [Mesorhizobium sp. B3-1-9]|nr:MULTISPECIES: putative RiPP precursor [unclassified Mesorhizobium]TPI36122.1 putative RiPP precursor [Mesorhizobium sp. B3-1-6]TPI40849.1 putative RiPP precursor [Mesorhizobium sp. B3-1-9]TPI53346.1 putative RiPP precursor [Mesorhizobium sp. B3-1-7]TPI70830.1 putative RiPP precursor [Mesorhizobium sp. B3-1-8]TPI74414.1 putative RiPP precursor [Mesorhizobium sp. B3-1-3]
MKKVYEKPTFARKGKLSAITAINGAGSGPINGTGPVI